MCKWEWSLTAYAKGYFTKSITVKTHTFVSLYFSKRFSVKYSEQVMSLQSGALLVKLEMANQKDACCALHHIFVLHLSGNSFGESGGAAAKSEWIAKWKCALDDKLLHMRSHCRVVSLQGNSFSKIFQLQRPEFCSKNPIISCTEHKQILRPVDEIFGRN